MNELGIGELSQRESVVMSDVDYYRHKYKDIEKQSDGSVVTVGFVSPVLEVFENYRFVLLQNSETIHLKQGWKYRPDYVSYEYYGTTNWWQLLMWINNVKSIEYFDKDTIVVPDVEVIYAIQNDVYQANSYTDLNEDDKFRKITSALYINPRSNIGDPNAIIDVNKTTKELTEPEEDSDSLIFCREKFVMDIPILRLKYVDLKNEPIEKSIRVISKCKPNLCYNKHYILSNSETGRNRISWDPDVVQNAGLLFKLRENDILEVQYAKKQ